METVWFAVVAVMIAAYVVLDGFDLGAGAAHYLVGRNQKERGSVINAISPVWDGNEVWLLAAGGTLYFAFPVLYSAAFSGFYLPLMIVLWLLILRAMGIELRHHVDDAMWRSFWDFLFAASSILLAVFFGAALGNVVRGVPLKRRRLFFRAALDDVHRHGKSRNFRLVYSYLRRGRARRADSSRRGLSRRENRK